MLRDIARIAAECGYTAEELNEIYRCEVAPALAFNAFSTAGVWGYFDTEWLEASILQPRGFGYWVRRLFVAPIPMFMLQQRWRLVLQFLPEEQKGVEEKSRDTSQPWHPCCAQDAPFYRWGPPPEVPRR